MSHPAPEPTSPATDTHVRFNDSRSVFYWMHIFDCTELELREAAAVLESTDLARLRHYFNSKH